MKRVQPIIVVLLLVGGCKTATVTTKSDPVVDGTKVVATRYEPESLSVTVDASDPRKAIFSVGRPERCYATTATTTKTTLTTITTVADVDKKNADTIQLAGAGLVAVGVIGGAALSTVTVFDPSARDDDNRFVPVNEQQGTALWPAGLGLAALGLVVGGTAAAAPMLIRLQESTTSTDENEVASDEARSPSCDRMVPMAGSLVMKLSDGGPVVLGTLNNGTVVVDLVTILDNILAAGADGQLLTVVGVDGRSMAEVYASWDREAVTFGMEDDTIIGTASVWAFPKLAAAQRANAANEQKEAAAREAARLREEAVRKADDAKRAAQEQAAEAARPKDPTADNLYRKFTADVYEYFDISVGSPLQRKRFEATAEFTAKQDELRRIREEARRSVYFVDIDDDPSVYSLQAKGVFVEVGSSWEGDVRPPKSVDNLLFPDLPTQKGDSIESIFKGMGYPTTTTDPLWAKFSSEVVFIPLSEEIGARVENRSSKARLRLYFRPASAAQKVFDFCSVEGRTPRCRQFSGVFLATQLLDIALVDVETGEVFHKRAFNKR